MTPIERLERLNRRMPLFIRYCQDLNTRWIEQFADVHIGGIIILTFCETRAENHGIDLQALTPFTGQPRLCDAFRSLFRDTVYLVTPAPPNQRLYAVLQFERQRVRWRVTNHNHSQTYFNQYWNLP